MKLDNTIKVLKEIHPDTIILIRVGTFYHAYGKDAYILSYLFNYQIKSVENSYNMCGMPKSAINKVMAKLEDCKISYITVLKSENYEKDSEMIFSHDNKYSEMYERAYSYVSKKNRINGIYNYLIENINSSDIKRKIQIVEDALFEGRKA